MTQGVVAAMSLHDERGRFSTVSPGAVPHKRLAATSFATLARLFRRFLFLIFVFVMLFDRVATTSVPDWISAAVD